MRVPLAGHSCFKCEAKHKIFGWGFGNDSNEKDLAALSSTFILAAFDGSTPKKAAQRFTEK